MASNVSPGSRIEIRRAARQVLVDGRVARLGARAFDVLLALYDRCDRLVTKNELLNVVWPGVVVEENNLQVQISTLRKVIGPQAITTIPGRGYQFTGEVCGVLGRPTELATTDRVDDAQEAAGPPAGTTLYGRAADIQTLSRLVREHKLVTVVGPAGIGKTRLVQAVARDLRETFAEGVFFVDLAPLAHADLVAGSVTRALGLAADGSGLGFDALAQSLAERCLLIVLDNCEHVLPAVDLLATALRSRAPAIHVLVTSQELLRHPDEQVYRLASLEVPTDADLARAALAGAVQLFVARAKAVAPRFDLHEQNVAVVVEICRRLDGIPLAIELAAARVPLLRVEGVRDRLDQRFRLLTAGSRSAMRRHQTLRAALDWSYRLLTDPERSLFDQLGVFAGSFSLECAQALAADGQMDEWAVLDHLGGLIDKSLVEVVDGSTARYRMLESTRAFALEQLAGSGATEQAMRRHAEVMLQLFERFYREMLDRPLPIAAVEQLAPDLDNVRGALRWATGAGGDRGIAIALFGAVGSRFDYLHYLMDRAERRDWCETLRPFADQSPAPLAARFWLACAQTGTPASPDRGAADARRAVTLFRQLDERPDTVVACHHLAFFLIQTGQLEEARQVLEEVLDLFDPSWPLWLHGQVHNTAAIVFRDLGDVARGRVHALQYLDFARQSASLRDEFTALAILVDADLVVGEFERAASTASEALARYAGSRSLVEDVLSLRILGTALACGARLEEAERAYRQALVHMKRIYGHTAYLLYDAAMFLALRGRLDDAVRVFSYADRVYREQGRHPRAVACQLRDRLLARLAAERSPEVAAQLRDEGRALTDEQACALAFPAPDGRCVEAEPAVQSGRLRNEENVR